MEGVRGRKKDGERGWRLQSNFNEHQGEYQIFFPASLSLSFSGYPMAHCSKSLSCKQGISHHALGFWLVSVSPCGTAWLTGCTCSAVLIEQMICQFVMFIFGAFPRRLAHSPQPPRNTLQMLAAFFMTDLVVITE